MSYSKKILEGSTYILAMHLLAGLIAYTLRLFIARSLTVEEFGLFYAVLALVGVLTIFRDWGFGPTLARFTADFYARGDKLSIKSSLIIVLAFELAAGAAIAVLTFIMADTLSLHYFKASASATLKIMIASAAVSGFFAIQFIFQGLGKMAHYSIVEPVRNGLTLLSAFFLIGMGAAGAAYSYLAASIIGAIILAAMLLHVFPVFKVKTAVTRGLAKTIFVFSGAVFMTSIAGTVLGYTDTVAITYLLSVGDVGLYQAALPTAQIIWILAGSVSVVLMPVVAALWAKKDRASLSKIIGLLMKFSFIAMIPMLITVAAFPDVVIRLLFGEGYIAASGALQILVITSLFYALFAIATASILGIGEPSLNTKIIFLVAAVDIVLNFTFIPIFGIAGAAITTLASYFMGAVLSIFCLSKRVQFKFYMADTVKAFIGGVLTFAIVWIGKSTIMADAWIELVALSLLGVAFYTSFLVYSKAMRKQDAEVLAGAGVPVPKFIMKMLK